MSKCWIISDQNEMAETIRIFIENAKNSPNGNDPRVIEILNEIEIERDVVKIHELVIKLIPLLM